MCSQIAPPPRTLLPHRRLPCCHNGIHHVFPLMLSYLDPTHANTQDTSTIAHSALNTTGSQRCTADTCLAATIASIVSLSCELSCPFFKSIGLVTWPSAAGKHGQAAHVKRGRWLRVLKTFHIMCASPCGGGCASSRS